MKVLILTVLLAIATTMSAQAEDEKQDPVKICLSISAFAETAMKIRQDGIPLSKILGTTSYDELFEGYIIRAYTETKWSSESRQKEAVTEFTNEILLECLAAFKSNV